VRTISIFGASGGLARAIARTFLNHEWKVIAVCRMHSENKLKDEFSSEIALKNLEIVTVHRSYSEYEFQQASDIILFTQALFEPSPLIDMKSEDINDEITVGLTVPIHLTQKYLQKYPSIQEKPRNICFIGSTSAYAGFKNTSVYCAVKHGLLGFVRALNDEYAHTSDRFWLFSMGTMLTEMGNKVQGQDSSTYLKPNDIAKRIYNSLTDSSNLFEPEVIIRRRHIKFINK
jgi:NAD(P)-dependent dehydrogenase (short-subunit alcohol dehydrogenase family)